jgi:pilus assembly protein CpaE
MAAFRERTIRDLIDESSSVDKDMIEAYCVEHPTGVRILPAPSQPDFAGFVQAEQVQKALSMMSEIFNYVVVDAQRTCHDTVLPALRNPRTSW